MKHWLPTDADSYVGFLMGELLRYGGRRKDRHGMFFGPSGSGKDTSLLIADLLLTLQSMIVLDPAGEALAVTGRFREQIGFVRVLDPMGVIAELAQQPRFRHLARFSSHGFDPLKRLTTLKTLATDVSQISEMAFPMNSDGRFWVLRARQLLDCLMMHEWISAHEKKRQPSMENVMDDLTLPHTYPVEMVGGVDIHAQKPTLQKLMIKISEHPYRPMARLAPSFIPKNDQTESVLATAISTCRSLISDEQIIDDIKLGGDCDWNALKNQIGTIYIVLPGHVFETHAIWLRMVLGDCLATMSKTGPGKYRPVLKLNEVGSLERLDALERAYRMIRKNGVRVHTYWQDLNQVEAIYGEKGARSMLANSGVKTTFATDDPSTMNYFSMRAGTETHEVDSYHTNAKGDDKNRQAMGFNTINPEDVSALPDCRTFNFIHQVRNIIELDAPHYTEFCKGYDENPYH